jgi:hypothetical protein
MLVISMSMMSRMNAMMSRTNVDPIDVIGNVRRHGNVTGMVMLILSLAW